MKHVLWISGWACPAEATLDFASEVFPQAEHRVVLPVPGCIENLDTAWADVVVAYSTGAFLLLGAPDKMRAAGTVVLVAPFADFRAESGRGGKTPAAKLRFLLRWLRRDPLAAVSDFYDRSGLGVPPSALPTAPEDLIWGIEQLATVAQPAPAKVTALVGDCDALLDADGLRGDFPDLQVVAGAGHALADFRKELADALR